jgi:hypothetical protein
MYIIVTYILGLNKTLLGTNGFRKGELGESGKCDSDGAINHALGQYGNSNLVKKVYEARSRRIAHSPQQSVQIDPNLLPQVQEFARITILQILYNISK